MGTVFEEPIRRFAELSGEIAYKHVSCEAIRLLMNLLFIEDCVVPTKSGVVHPIYEPTAGTGHAERGGLESAPDQPRSALGNVRPGAK